MNLLFELSNLISNFALTLGYLNPALNNPALDLPCDLYPHFDLQNLTEDERVAEFRSRKTDIPRLSQALRIPDVINCHQGIAKELKDYACF